jgi:2,4-dienoyl-CoA reductase-like NADH-dependent reductase (Old Yellow Enzyme family)
MLRPSDGPVHGRPLTNELDAPYGGSLDNRLRFAFDTLREIRKRVGDGVHRRHPLHRLTRICRMAAPRKTGWRFPAVSRIPAWLISSTSSVGTFDTDPAMTDVIPDSGHAQRPASGFRRRDQGRDGFPTFHAARIPMWQRRATPLPFGQARHGGHDARPHDRPAYRAQDHRGREDDIRPCVGATYCLDRIYQGRRWPIASTTRPPAAKLTDAAHIVSPGGQ